VSRTPTAENGLAAASGGSARSQASAIDERRWRPRRALAFGIQTVAVVVPLAAALVAVEVASHVLTRPRTLAPFIAWLLALMALATVVLRVVDAQSRRLLPLAALLRLSLVFPDHAPSRFGVALRSGSGRALQRSATDPADRFQHATPQESAEAVIALVGAISRHDRLTRGHCERVRAYADLIGQQLRLDPESAAKLHWAALLHDVGKLDVPAAVLAKKGELTPEEWAQVREHPAAAEHWLAGLRPWLGDWARAASEHHERFDGAGYPYGLAAEEISVAGRIVAVADSFDVMTSARSYKKPFPPAQARVELTDNAGTQFDPVVVRAFLEISIGDLRRVMGPIAWLATVPELLRLGVSSALAPVHSAAATAGVAAASLVPLALTPAPIAPPAVTAAEADAGVDTDAPARDGRGSEPSEPRGTGRSPAEAASPAEGTSDDPNNPGAPPPPTTTTTAAPRTGTPPATSPATSPTSVPGGGGPGSTTTSSTTSTTQPPQHAPVAVDDSPPAVTVGNQVLIDVLGNDTDADGNLDPATLRIVNKSGAASVQHLVVVGGKVEFLPDQLYIGPTWFVYEVCDTTNRCDTATASLTIVA
jgi:HD-GYP domain-containing protein (c-di-GMP phosphodiesterase class II)